MSLDPAALQQVTVTNANGVLEIVRDAAGAWSLAGLAPDETADAAALQGLGSRIASISLTAPLGTAEEASYGMESPTAVVAAVVSDTAAGVTNFSRTASTKSCTWKPATRT